jgi:membrane associated rhomboid family serine protease
MGAMVVISRNRGLDIWSNGIGGLLVINIMISFIVPNISIGGHLGGLAVGALSTFVLDPGPRPAQPKVGSLLAAVFVIGGSIVLFFCAMYAAGFAVGRL